MVVDVPLRDASSLHQGITIVLRTLGAKGIMSADVASHFCPDHAQAGQKAREINAPAAQSLPSVFKLSLAALKIHRGGPRRAEPIWAGCMGAAERRGLTPLAWGYRSPYGLFHLDMTMRLPPDLPGMGADHRSLPS